jgi:hypothetical protein
MLPEIRPHFETSADGYDECATLRGPQGGTFCNPDTGGFCVLAPSATGGRPCWLALADYQLPPTDYHLPTSKQRCQQLSHGPPGHRVLPVRRDFREWRQNESAVPKSRMGHYETRLVDDQIAVEDQIQIESTRRTWIWALAAEALLDVLERAQKITGREARLADRGGIQKPRLVTDANGIGFVKGRHAHVSKMFGKSGDRFAQQSLAVAEVAAEGYGDRNHAGEYRATKPGGLKPPATHLPLDARRSFLASVLASPKPFFKERIDRRHEHERHHR